MYISSIDSNEYLISRMIQTYGKGHTYEARTVTKSYEFNLKSA